MKTAWLVALSIAAFTVRFGSEWLAKRIVEFTERRGGWPLKIRPHQAGSNDDKGNNGLRS